MPGSAKAMAVCTLGALVVASLYSVAVGSSGLVWFAWVVLVLVTAGLVAERRV